MGSLFKVLGLGEFYILCLFLFSCFIANAQTGVVKRNTIYAEGLGNSVVFSSINYDRVFKQWNKFYLSNSTGIGYDIIQIVEHNRSFNISNMINGTLRLGKNSGLEFGAGLSYNLLAGLSSYIYNDSLSLRPYRYTRLLLPMSFQYKYQRPNGGFFLKVGLTPKGILKDTQEPCTENAFLGCWKNFDLFLHSLGLSVGFSF
jgi:hypothetical protein